MTIKVCDLPPTDRPQYRLAQLGGNYLSNVELLALIIGTDQSIAIAQRLFAKFKTLDNIKPETLQELETIKGIGKSQAGKIVACLEISKRIQENHTPTKKLDAITSQRIVSCTKQNRRFEVKRSGSTRVGIQLALWSPCSLSSKKSDSSMLLISTGARD